VIDRKNIARHTRMGKAETASRDKQTFLALRIAEKSHRRNSGSFLFVCLAIIFSLLAPQCVRADVQYTLPQTVNQLVFSAAATAQLSPNNSAFPCTATPGTPCAIPNLGQNIHFLTYTVAGNAALNNVTKLVIRLEGSNDGVSFFPISDDATDTQRGQVFAVGYYPIIRANLVVFTIFSGTPTLTAAYTGTSATSPGLQTGLISSGQNYRKVVFDGVSAGSNQQSLNIPTPFGSTLGYLLVSLPSGSFPGGSSITVNSQTYPGGGTGGFPGSVVTCSLSVSTNQVCAVPAYPATGITLFYTSGGASAATFSVSYVFVNPSSPTGLSSSSTQPPVTANKESVSAANTPVTITIGAFSLSPAMRAHLYSVSARCSAGSAQLTILDGVAGTQIFSTSTTEVGTTTFRFQWNPGLASSITNALVVSLGTCGAANTGTLDVEASTL
jgi:hypothetical protein